jgi:hypothetical protein
MKVCCAAPTTTDSVLQYCMSGDETLGATAQAIKDVAAQTPADARYVFMVSDANLRRYGISPATLGAGVRLCCASWIPPGA